MYVVKCIWSNVSNPSCNNAFSNNLRESRKVFCVKTTQTLYLKVLCGRKLKMQKKYDSLSTVDLEKERMKESIKKASHSRLKSNNIVQYREVRPDCFRMPLRYFVHLYNIVYTVYYPLIHCSIVLILAQCATTYSMSSVILLSTLLELSDLNSFLKKPCDNSTIVKRSKNWKRLFSAMKTLEEC